MNSANQVRPTKICLQKNRSKIEDLQLPRYWTLNDASYCGKHIFQVKQYIAYMWKKRWNDYSQHSSNTGYGLFRMFTAMIGPDNGRFRRSTEPNVEEERWENREFVTWSSKGCGPVLFSGLTSSLLLDVKWSTEREVSWLHASLFNGSTMIFSMKLCDFPSTMSAWG